MVTDFIVLLPCMNKPSFDIISPEWNNEQEATLKLVLEIGDKFLTIIILNESLSRLLAIRQYHIDHSHERSNADKILDLLSHDDLLQHHHYITEVIYNYPESDLVPETAYDVSILRPLSSFVHGDTGKSLVLSEKIDYLNLYNIYRVPGAIHSAVQKQFSAGKYWHYYSLFLCRSGELEEGRNCIHLTLYPDRFILASFRGKDLLLINSYHYHTPEDVAYFALAVCNEHDFEVSEVIVEIKGLINEQSALYTEIKKYFVDVRKGELPGTVDTGDLLVEYPDHYFSPILNLALCV